MSLQLPVCEHRSCLIDAFTDYSPTLTPHPPFARNPVTGCTQTGFIFFLLAFQNQLFHQTTDRLHHRWRRNRFISAATAETLMNSTFLFSHWKQKQVLVGVWFYFLAVYIKMSLSYDSEEECDFWSKLQQSSTATAAVAATATDTAAAARIGGQDSGSRCPDGLFLESAHLITHHLTSVHPPPRTQVPKAPCLFIQPRSRGWLLDSGWTPCFLGNPITADDALPTARPRLCLFTGPCLSGEVTHLCQDSAPLIISARVGLPRAWLYRLLRKCLMSQCRNFSFSQKQIWKLLIIPDLETI